MSGAFQKADLAQKSAVPNQNEFLDRALTPSRYLCQAELNALAFSESSAIPDASRKIFVRRFKDNSSDGYGVTVKNALKILTNQGVSDEDALTILKTLATTIGPEAIQEPSLYRSKRIINPEDEIANPEIRQLPKEVRVAPLEEDVMGRGLAENGATLACDGQILMLTKNQLSLFVYDNFIDPNRPFVKVDLANDKIKGVRTGEDIRETKGEMDDVDIKHGYGFVIPPGDHEEYKMLCKGQPPSQEPAWVSGFKKSMHISRLRAMAYGALAFVVTSVGSWGIGEVGNITVQSLGSSPAPASQSLNESQEASSQDIITAARFDMNLNEALEDT